MLEKTALVPALTCFFIGVTTPITTHANDDAPTLALEEVIVTARKRAESMQLVPVAVSAITAAELAQSSIRNLQDIQGFVPNLLIDRVPGLQSGAAIAIRGVSYQEIDKSLDPGIGVLLDGVYLGTNSGQILENFDLERIEVLRGPQGTLFGKNTIGGALSIIRTAPTKEFGMKVQGTLGENDRQDIRGLLNLPLTDKGGIKLFASKLESDGYIKNTTYNKDQGGQNLADYGVTLAYQFTDELDVSFTAERTRDKSEVGAWADFNKFEFSVPQDAACLLSPDFGGCFLFDTGSDEDHSSTNAPNSADTTNDFFNLTINYDLSDWMITSITGYIDRDERSRQEYDANSLEFLYVNVDESYSQFSQELRTTGNIGDVVMTAGLYYWHSEYDAAQTSYDLWKYLPTGPFPTNSFGGTWPVGTRAIIKQRGENTSYAAFASADWSLTDKLTLNLAARYTYDERSLQPSSSQFESEDGSPLVPGGETVKVDADWDQVSPRIGAQYDFTDDLMAYVSYSEGFKGGGFFGRITSVDNVRQYNPETVETYEAGVKSDWWNQRLRINAAVFTSEYKDKQEDIIVTDPSGLVDTVVLNASSATMQGLELEMTALLADGLTLVAQGGYLDAGYDNFQIAGIPGVPDDASKLKMRNTPEFTFGAGVRYVQPVFDDSEMSYNVNYAWRDSYVTIFNNDPLGDVDALGFWNANIDFRLRDMLTVSVYGRNITDERYYRAVLIPPLASFGQWNEPRNYGVTLTYTF